MTHVATQVADRSFFGHPRGLGLLFAAEMWERFSFYGMRALLVLYLVNVLEWDKVSAASLYGTYTMLVYLTPLIGGYLADKYIGTHRALLIGGAVISAGHFVLALPGMQAFYAGLGLVVIGTGFFKANVSTMVGQLYEAGDTRRDSGFTLFYMGINTGGFLGPLVCGYLAQSPRFGWHYGFAAAGVGMVLGLIMYSLLKRKYLGTIGDIPAARLAPATDTVNTASAMPDVSIRNGIVGAVVGGVLAWLISSGSLLGVMVGATIGGALAISVLGTSGEERNRVIALFIVAFFVVFFWAAFEQAGSSMSLFADKNTNLQLGSFTIPSSWFQSVNSFFIIAFAPIFAWMWVVVGKRGLEPSTPLKMSIGLALIAIGFGILMIGGSQADTGVKVSPMFLIGAFLFHTFGELCLSPVGLSYVTKVAPVRFASLLMGVWFLANAAANKVAGFLAGYTPLPGEAAAAPQAGFGGYIQQLAGTNRGFFSIFVVSSLTAAIVLFFCVPLLKRLTRTVKA
ncbi:MAG TPA: MFS transporter [Gemmatimonas aurantiaca]|uniref:Di-/tripeptide transporter n=2 Tax=Gemmatimonas aurantiaca TaxID=173480 RepID=C1A6D8_GEMAT|nr:peptide MFS transporter [Gemmatimonas aurantiaca]BAH37798.1 di-/tripeptide transporter [Gemmatimonas aurantiaca T-27]HCT56576.1 MFS transporter [Gemmatimonas aurantiaca]